MKRFLTVFAFVAACCFQTTQAQWAQQGNKLVGTGGVSAQQGYSLAISDDGNTMIVGGANDNTAVGAAWVFTRSGEVWTQQGSKLVGTAGAQAQLGRSVALSADGNTALVGAANATHVFTRSGTTWTQQGNPLVGTGAVGNAGQGNGVALSADGNTALIGGPNDNNNIGAIWIFTRSGSTWTQQGNKLVGTGSVGTIVFFGYSVALSSDGNTAVIGGPLDNNAVGAVWVFTRSGGAWTQQGNKILATGTIGASPELAWRVDVSADGNTAAAGSILDNNSQGAVFIFTRSGSTWTQQAKLIGTGAVGTNIQQGWSVSMSTDGNRVISGGFLDNSDVGAAWVFSRSGTTWTQEGNKLVGTGGVPRSWQGYSVAMSGDGLRAASGGVLDASNIGAVWAYARGNFVSTPLNTGTTVNLGGVSFINRNNGCIAGAGGTVRITTNGGVSWTTSTTGTTTDLTGIRLIGGSGFITGLNGLICRSTNNGVSWVPFTTGTTVTFYGSSYSSETAGWAVGGNGTICIFNGTSWVAQTTGVTIDFRGIYAIGSTGFAVGAGGTICRWSGSAWVPQSSGTTTVTFNDVAFLNSNFGYTVGTGGTICKTTNGGTTWTPLTSGSTANLRSIRIGGNLNVAWTVGDGGVLLTTTDGGTSWRNISLGTTSNLAAVDFVDGQGIIVGAGGIGYSFQDAGATSVKEIRGSDVPFSFALEQNYPNPFNPTTNIRFTLLNAGFTLLKVYDVLGREVATLVNENLNEGIYEATFDATSLASGVYYYRLQSGDFVSTKRMLLLK